MTDKGKRNVELMTEFWKYVRNVQTSILRSEVARALLYEPSFLPVINFLIGIFL